MLLNLPLQPHLPFQILQLLQQLLQLAVLILHPPRSLLNLLALMTRVMARAEAAVVAVDVAAVVAATLEPSFGVLGKSRPLNAAGCKSDGERHADATRTVGTNLQIARSSWPMEDCRMPNARLA